MSLFIQINDFSNLIAETSIGINFDIFETNIVNLTILTGGIFYLGSNALSESLTERQERILGAIQESEERLAQATQRLKESEAQLEQAQIVISSIKSDAEKTAKQVKNTILAEGKVEIERLASVSKSQIITIESKIRKQISDYIVTLTLQRVSRQLIGKISYDQHGLIIERNISKLSKYKW